METPISMEKSSEHKRVENDLMFLEFVNDKYKVKLQESAGE